MSKSSQDDLVEIGKRIKEERLRLNMSQKEFVEKAGLSAKTTQINYEKGRRQPPLNYLQTAESFGVDTGYILTGIRKEDDIGLRDTQLFWERFNILRQDKPIEEIYRLAGLPYDEYDRFIESYESQSYIRAETKIALANALGCQVTTLTTPTGKWQPQQTSLSDFHPISTWDDNTPLEDDEVEIPFYRDLEFACGHGATNLIMENDQNRMLRMGRRTLQNLGIQPTNIFAATARDQSMNPTINQGSTIWVDKGRTTIKDGKIFAIEWGDLYLCKRLYKAPNGGVRIVSDNHYEYPELTLTAEQIQQQHFRIIGWVWHWSVIESW